jgi:pilus assembly protein CpaB
LSLVLRNQADPKPGDTGGATKATLLNEELAPVVVAAAPAAPSPAMRRAAPPPAPRPIVAAVERTCVEVIRGTSRTNECF